MRAIDDAPPRATASEDPIRVALVGPYPGPGQSPVGGVEVSLARLARGLAESGVDVSVITPGERAEWADGPVSVLRVPSEKRLALVRGFRRWKKEVAHVVRRVRPDVIHGLGLPAAGVAAMHGGYEAPRVLTVHGNDSRENLIASGRPAMRARTALRRAYSKSAARRADVVVGVHPDWQINLPVGVERFVYIPNAVDSAYFESDHGPERGRVLFCGGGRRVKGWDILQLAWEEVARAVPEARLDVVGWPDQAGQDLGGNSSVIVRGWLSRDETRAAMKRAQALVIPSRYEVAPMVLCEAWALGLPVVAAAVGGIPSLAKGAATLVPAEDPASLARALISVLTGETDTSKLVAEGRRRAQAFTSEQVVAAHIDLYRRLRDERAGHR
jgi:glycosyltransferase involved in cell wall biosynthesis